MEKSGKSAKSLTADTEDSVEMPGLRSKARAKVIETASNKCKNMQNEAVSSKLTIISTAQIQKQICEKIYANSGLYPVHREKVVPFP